MEDVIVNTFITTNVFIRKVKMIKYLMKILNTVFVID